MIKSKIFSRIVWTLFIVSFISQNAYSQDVILQDEYVEAATKIRKKYENNAYKLKPSKAGHMGMRFWRNYKDDKYKYLLLQGINYTSNSLDKLVLNGLDDASLNAYVARKNKKYKANTKKKKLRKKTFKNFPKYRLMSTSILRHVARLDELGLRHKNHDEFMQLIKSYDYHRAFTNQNMIKAWGAQLANQVYWLHNIEVADYRRAFYQSVFETYPQEKDLQINDQQFENKIYTLTHIIIAASEYYRYNVEYTEYQEVVDYFRENVDMILKRCKEDVIIEVGLSLLLVNETYPEIDKIKEYVLNKMSKKKRMILSKNGNSKFAEGEHRNIIAVLLLDWKGCSMTPTSKDVKKLMGSVDDSVYMIKNKS